MLGNRYYPNAPELEGMIAWTATRAPSPLACLIAGIALRNGDLSIGGLRSRDDENALYGDAYSPADLDRAFTCDRALMLDSGYGFEEQVLRALVHLQMNPPERNPDRFYASNIQAECSRVYACGISLGAVIVAALACGYTIDHSLTEAERGVLGDAFFEVPENRSPAVEIYPRGRP